MRFHSSVSGFEELMENFSQEEIRQMISKVSQNVIISSIVTVTRMIINKSKLVGLPITTYVDIYWHVSMHNICYVQLL